MMSYTGKKAIWNCNNLNRQNNSLKNVSVCVDKDQEISFEYIWKPSKHCISIYGRIGLYRPVREIHKCIKDNQ